MMKFKISKSVKIGVVIFLPIILLIGMFFYKINIYDKDIKHLINIDDLSKEFMDNYFKGLAELNDNNNKDNILIVTSKNKMKDTYGATDVVEAPNNQFFLQYETEDDKNNALELLKNEKTIFSVEENIRHTLLDVEDNNISEYNSWGIKEIGLNHAIDIANSKELENITVAIIDSGCDMDLFNKFYNGKIEKTYNIYDNDDTMYDNRGHGTHIAGTIAEGTPNNVKILPIKATDSDGFWSSDIIASINYIVYNNAADVINMSFGSYESTDSEYLAIETAKEKNIISVAAAGNDNISRKHYPAGYDNTISISAVDSSREKGDFSNYGSTIDFAAPGVNILSINGVKSGTSMAAPHATGAIAILKSFNNDLSLDDIINILKENVIDLGIPGYDEYFGYGLINLSELEVCEDFNEESCNDGFKKFIPINVEISSPQLTDYNYGSITNILSTEISIVDKDNNRKIKKLYEIDNLEVSGYDPYLSGKQLVTIKYDNFETSFEITNPENYELGWIYNEDNNAISITGYKDSTQLIKKLYFPEIINDKYVIKINDSSKDYVGVFNNSNNILDVEEIILPESIEYVGNFSFKGFNSLKKIVSLSKTLTVGRGSFYNLSHLYELDANIVLLNNSTYAFYGTKMLDKVVLSENTSNIIPAFSFYDCGLTHGINLPDFITIIENSAFMNSKIKKIKLPSYLIEIQANAFYNTLLKEIYIPSLVKIIDYTAFASNQDLSSLNISADNLFYDSRDNSNAIIESSTNKLITGTKSTVIPDTIEIIDDFAFLNTSIKTITIPSSVKLIGVQSFSFCNNLSSVIMPKENLSIDSSAFDSSGENTMVGTILYVYKDSYSELFAEENNYSYTYIENLSSDYEIIGVSHLIKKRNYNAFEKVDVNDIDLSVTFMNKTTKEIINEDIDSKTYKFIYQKSDDYLMAHDFNYTVSFDTNNGYHNLKFIVDDITVDKIVPSYNVPETLEGRLGQKLDNVALPNGFEWLDGGIIMDKLGMQVFNAKYVPEDVFNYEIVDDIEIKVNVTETAIGTIKNDTVDFSGLYDGNNHSIKINVDVLNYTIKYSVDNTNYDLDELPSFKDVGEYTINYKISCPNYKDLYGSNKIKIYGLKLEPSVIKKDNYLIISNNDFLDLKSKISYYNEINFGITVKLFDKNQEAKDIHEISTSDILELSNPFILEKYILVYLGDTSGDGKINYLDYVNVYNHIQKVKHPESNKILLKNEYLTAADMSGDGNITYLDYVKIYNKIKEIKGGIN